MLKNTEKRVWPNWPSPCFKEKPPQKSRDLDRVKTKDEKTYVEGLRFFPPAGRRLVYTYINITGSYREPGKGRLGV